MSYFIRKSTLADLPVILNLRDQAREIMRSYGNTFQWPDGYPPDERFVNDIRCGGPTFHKILFVRMEFPIKPAIRGVGSRCR